MGSILPAVRCKNGTRDTWVGIAEATFEPLPQLKSLTVDAKGRVCAQADNQYNMMRPLDKASYEVKDH